MTVYLLACHTANNCIIERTDIKKIFRRKLSHCIQTYSLPSCLNWQKMKGQKSKFIGMRKTTLTGNMQHGSPCVSDMPFNQDCFNCSACGLYPAMLMSETVSLGMLIVVYISSHAASYAILAFLLTCVIFLTQQWQHRGEGDWGQRGIQW